MSPSQSRSRSGVRPSALADSVASLPGRATVAQMGVEAIDSATPLGVDLLYRWDDANTSVESERNPDQEEFANSHMTVDPFHGESCADSSPAAPYDAHEANTSPSRQEGAPATGTEDHLSWCRHLPWWKQPSNAFLRPVIFLLALAYGVVIPVRVEVLDLLACESLYYAPAPAVPGFPTHPRMASNVDRLSWFSGSPSRSVAPHIPNGPDDPTLCHSPAVLTVSASLQMRITVACGLLSVLTTGWWTGRSDRKGRRGVMIWGALGMVVNAAVYVITIMVPRNRLPGGPNFLLVGSIFEGLVGGMPTAMATFSAYISDTTPPGTKAMGYSMFLGLFFGAMAIAPILGGRIVAVSGLASVFLMATIMNALYFCFATLFLPESCSPANISHAEMQYQARIRLTKAQLDSQLASATTWTHKLWAILAFHASHAFQPLAVLVPSKVEATSPAEDDAEATSLTMTDENSPLLTPNRRASTYSTTSVVASAEANASYISVSHVSKRWRRDYNLLIVALAMWFEASALGLVGSKMLYAQQHFAWGPADMGDFMTAVSLSRVLALTLILPLAIKLLHRPPRRIVLSHDNDAQHDLLDYQGRALRRPSSSSGEEQEDPDDNHFSPLVSPTESEQDQQTLTEAEQGIEQAWALRATHLRLLHDSRFDLRVARTSIMIAVAAYIGTATARSGEIFVLWSCAACLSAGGGAAISSLAVALLKDPKDAGRLFGATSLLSAVGQTVASPVIFTRVYQKTADTPYSWAIFVLAAGLFATAFLLLCLVRVRKPESLPALPPRPAPRPVSFAP